MNEIPTCYECRFGKERKEVAEYVGYYDCSEPNVEKCVPVCRIFYGQFACKFFKPKGEAI